jgi:hypothetical protein
MALVLSHFAIGVYIFPFCTQTGKKCKNSFKTPMREYQIVRRT